MAQTLAVRCRAGPDRAAGTARLGRIVTAARARAERAFCARTAGGRGLLSALVAEPTRVR
ncbi:hypothetical protein ACIBCM_03380 [Streptomyces sp. NPDC051018]|uniref:hypothetical protein n=1 Tax=Streptomyces sp. NPDC051018 TaxID=3365639 RepID=UPI0037B3343D